MKRILLAGLYLTSCSGLNLQKSPLVTSNSSTPVSANSQAGLPSQEPVLPSQDSSTQTPDPGSVESLPNTDRTIPPHSITGAYLTCVIATEANQYSYDSTAFCRLETKDKKRVPGATYTIISSANSDVKFRVVTAAAGSTQEYDVTVTATAESKNASIKALTGAKISASIEGASIKASVGNTPLPADKSGFSLIKTSSGQKLGFDSLTGLYWSPDFGIQASLSDGETTCDALSYEGFTDWRLPTLSELEFAHTHNIASIADTNGLSIIAGGDGYLSSSLTASLLPDDSVLSDDILCPSYDLSSIHKGLKEVNRLRILCVR